MLFDERLTNHPIYNVTQMSGVIKTLIEGTFVSVKIKGEVSDYKKHSSGHVYFCVRDDNAVLNVTLWKDKARKLSFKIENGMEVVISGCITTYEKSSRYQIDASMVEISGEGELAKIIQERKLKLEKEGVFDPILKKPIPLISTKIGIITSKTGSVLTDILNRISERMECEVLVYNSIMQGPQCCYSVISGILYFNKLGLKYKPDVIIIARGGGSSEDLFYFNDEDLVRKISKSKIPIITAIGHGTDTTLSDLASDKYAVTPTAAAEIVTSITKKDLSKTINALFASISFGVKQKIMYTISTYNITLVRLSSFDTGLIERVNANIIHLFEKITFLFQAKLIHAEGVLKDFTISKKVIISDIENKLKTLEDLFYKIIILIKSRLLKSQNLINSFNALGINSIIRHSDGSIVYNVEELTGVTSIIIEIAGRKAEISEFKIKVID